MTADVSTITDLQCQQAILTNSLFCKQNMIFRIRERFAIVESSSRLFCYGMNCMAQN